MSVRENTEEELNENRTWKMDQQGGINYEIAARLRGNIGQRSFSYGFHAMKVGIAGARSFGLPIHWAWRREDMFETLGRETALTESFKLNRISLRKSKFHSSINPSKVLQDHKYCLHIKTSAIGHHGLRFHHSWDPAWSCVMLWCLAEWTTEKLTLHSTSRDLRGRVAHQSLHD